MKRVEIAVVTVDPVKVVNDFVVPRRILPFAAADDTTTGSAIEQGLAGLAYNRLRLFQPAGGRLH